MTCCLLSQNVSFKITLLLFEKVFKTNSFLRKLYFQKKKTLWASSKNVQRGKGGKERKGGGGKTQLSHHGYEDPPSARVQ